MLLEWLCTRSEKSKSIIHVRWRKGKKTKTFPREFWRATLFSRWHDFTLTERETASSPAWCPPEAPPLLYRSRSEPQSWTCRCKCGEHANCSSLPLSLWLSCLVLVEPSGERRQAEAVRAAHRHCLAAILWGQTSLRSLSKASAGLDWSHLAP